MDLFAAMQEHSHEQVVFCSEPAVGYTGIIAIHDTTLGPALGGTRFWNYDSFDAAVVDALRLSRGMTYKAAVAGLDLGGGKSVIIGDNRRADREALFRAHGRAVESLGGRYITAEDVGTSPSDMTYVRFETPHVTGLQGLSGDPSPVTAWGVYHGMRAAANKHWGTADLSGRTVAIQGCGHVGYWLAKYLKEREGANLIVTDVDQAKVQRLVDEFGATAVGTEDIYGQDADIFAPCALGAVINDQTIAVLKAEVVAGGANNQLAEERHGDMLYQKDKTYAPDYVINSGGLINVYGEIHNWAPDRALTKASEIYDTMGQIFAISGAEGIPSYQAAGRLGRERVEAVRRLKKMWLPGTK